VISARTWRSAGLVAVSLLTITSLGACRRPTNPPPPPPPPPTSGPTNTNPTDPPPPTTQRPPSGGGTQTITSTQTVSGNFDGGGRTYRGGGNLGSGGDGEGKDPLFKLNPGATISNLRIGTPASDGIHCMGTCTIRNVVWDDVLDDAATLKGTNRGDVMTIDGGSAHKADDKVFQHNGPGKVVIRNFTVQDFGKLYRSCGNCSNNATVAGQGGRHVEIVNVTAIGPGKELAGINENYGDTATFTNVTVRNDSGKKLVTCGRYRGVTSGEPSKQGTGASANCRNTQNVRWV
jgi:pectate lyase